MRGAGPSSRNGIAMRRAAALHKNLLLLDVFYFCNVAVLQQTTTQ
jgi:hypothetical protein